MRYSFISCAFGVVDVFILVYRIGQTLKDLTLHKNYTHPILGWREYIPGCQRDEAGTSEQVQVRPTYGLGLSTPRQFRVFELDLGRWLEMPLAFTIASFICIPHQNFVHE